MSKYIDADKLIERLEEIKQAEYENCGGVNAKTGALQEVQELIPSLQEERPNDIVVPLWCIKNIENTLSIQNNINLEKKTAETCQDRNIRGSLNQIRKLLKGEELSGLERLEPLRKQPEVDLEKAIDDYYHENLGFIIGPNDIKKIVEDIARHFYELALADVRKKAFEIGASSVQHPCIELVQFIDNLTK